MTGAECAAFATAKKDEIAKCLMGSYHDKLDAISEVACKCMEAGIGTGSVLKWQGNPFAVARTEEQWLSFLVWQCRARLKIIRDIRNYWHDPDIIGAFTTDDDGVCDNQFDRALVEEIERGDADKVGKCSGGESDAECKSDEQPEEEAVPDYDYGKKYHQRKIIEFLLAEEDRRLGNHQRVPDYDDKVSYRAAYAVLADIAKEYSISRRDLGIWMACIMYNRDRREVAEMFEVTKNNLEQIIHRVKDKLETHGPALHRKHFRRLFHDAA